jgi:hypothetical protein
MSAGLNVGSRARFRHPRCRRGAPAKQAQSPAEYSCPDLWRSVYPSLSLLLTCPYTTAQRQHGLADKGCPGRRALRVFTLWFVYSLVCIAAALVTPGLGFLTALFFYACNGMLSRSHRRDGINKPMLGSACLLWTLVR